MPAWYQRIKFISFFYFENIGNSALKAYWKDVVFRTQDTNIKVHRKAVIQSWWQCWGSRRINYMIIHNLLLCLPSWAGPCEHGMNHSLKPCWLRHCHTCHCRMRCQWECSATAHANSVFTAHASALKNSKAASCSLRDQSQHKLKALPMSVPDAVLLSLEPG